MKEFRNYLKRRKDNHENSKTQCGKIYIKKTHNLFEFKLGLVTKYTEGLRIYYRWFGVGLFKNLRNYIKHTYNPPIFHKGQVSIYFVLRLLYVYNSKSYKGDRGYWVTVTKVQSKTHYWYRYSITTSFITKKILLLLLVLFSVYIAIHENL